MRFETSLIHPAGDRDPADAALSVPIHQAVISNQPDVDRRGPYWYSRIANPTRTALEQSIAGLEQGAAGFAFASGMAAIAAALSLFSAGDHLVVAQDVYGATVQALDRVFKRFGIDCSYADATDPQRLAEAVTPRTKALYLETPSNPYLKVTDLRAACALAREHDLLTIVDNTFMTPYLQRPLELGCDLVLHSATKGLGGHSDVIAGLIVTREAALGEEIGFLQTTLGAVLSPHDSWLVMRGMKTLAVRMERAQATAQLLADRLLKLPEVTDVHYPGLPDHPGYEVHRSQASGPGNVLSFHLASEEIARRFYERRRLPVFGASLGGVETILSVPNRMSHAALPDEQKRELRIDDTLVRLSVGLEHPEDLMADLEQAMADE